MPRDRDRGEEYARPIRRLLVALLVMACLALFLVWRIEQEAGCQITAGEL